MNGNRVIPATAAESFVLSAARNFSMKPSNSVCKAGEATAFFGAWATAGARFTRAVTSIILSKNPTGRLHPSTNQGLPTDPNPWCYVASRTFWLAGAALTPPRRGPTAFARACAGMFCRACLRQKLAHRDILRCRTNLVAIGAKRTLLSSHHAAGFMGTRPSHSLHLLTLPARAT